MRCLFGAICVGCLIAVGCGQQPAGNPSSSTNTAEKPAKTPEGSDDKDDFIVGEAVAWKNLTIYPVKSREPKNDDRYITLEEGLKSGKVEVLEVGAQVEGAQPEDDTESAGDIQDPTLDEPAIPDAQQNDAASEDDLFGEEKPEAELPESANQDNDPFGNNDPVGDNPFGDDDPIMQGNANEPPQTGNAASILPPDNPSDDDYVEVDGDVNRLVIINRSEKPLYLMPGEVIYGGKQDRAIAEETIVLADGKPVSVDVYCVEQGRWEGRSNVAANAGIAFLANVDGQTVDEETVQKLADDTRKGKFVAKAGNLTQKGRMAVQAKKDQMAVWNDVGAANSATGARTNSDTFTANFTSEEISNKTKEFVEKIEAPVSEQEQVVGAIIAVNGEIKAVDVFGSTPLFRKVWPKLLQGHVLDAIVATDSPQSDEPSTREKAKQFMETVMAADVEKRTEGGLVVTQREDDNVVSYSAEEPAAMGGMGGMGSFGSAVHSSGFAK